MTTLEEMLETFLEGSIADKFGNVDPTLGLTAVLERHVRGMIAEAYKQGSWQIKAQPEDKCAAYADRIITQLKGQKE